MSSATVPVPMPTLIRWGYRISLLVGTLSVLVALVAAAGLGDMSNVKELPFGEWNLPVWGANFLVGGAFLVVVGYSLRARQPAARRLIVASWLAGGVLMVCEYLLARREVGRVVALAWVASHLLLSIPTLAIATWYLFRKQNVVSYFKGLQAAHPEA